jgi:hypothetical protein
MFARIENDQILLRFPSHSSNPIDAIIRLSNSFGGKKNESTLEIHRWNSKESLISQRWIPIEGIYGVFLLPSGWHLALITESEHIYESTPYTDGFSPPLLNIRRIQSIEIVSLGISNQRELSSAEKKAEERQLRLLRKAFREHDLYFVPVQVKNKYYNPTETRDVIVADLTNTVQRCFLSWRNRRVDDLGRVEIRFTKHELPSPWNMNSSEHLYDSISFTTGHGSTMNIKNRMITFPLAVTGGLWERIITNTTLMDEWDHITSRDFSGQYSSRTETSHDEFSHKHISRIVQCLDSRFFWNEKNLEPFFSIPSSSPETEDLYDILFNFCLPVTSAFIGVKRDIHLVSNSSQSGLVYDEILISRRSKYRAGTRFTRRGSDGNGAVANFVETEQICIVKDSDNEALNRSQAVVMNSTGHSIEIYSHVQTRGSIPLRWSSPADVKTYRPRVLIGTDPLSQARALRNHLFEQLYTYCMSPYRFSSTSSINTDHLKLVFVNLVDKKSDQGRLGRAFDSVLNAVIDVYSKYFQICSKDDSVAPNQILSNLLNTESIKHLWFDFHENVKHGKWSKLVLLLDQVSTVLDQQGYFCAMQQDGVKWKIQSIQKGVIRTNCMDCLDRTNVAQSMFGRYILFKQLQDRKGMHSRWKHIRKAMQHFPARFTSEFQRNSLKLPWVEGEEAHRLLWADNADVISRLYAGTNALKGDFTRTGVRTRLGVFDDGINSLQRYYLNNFQDAERQEAIDLLVGNVNYLLDNELLLSNSEETKYARIKTNQKTNKSRINLRLQWLPGDLQNQVRSCSISHFAQQLSDIDRRASSDKPWWAIESNA